MAILGLRSLYFSVSGIMDYFRYLKDAERDAGGDAHIIPEGDHVASPPSSETGAGGKKRRETMRCFFLAATCTRRPL